MPGIVHHVVVEPPYKQILSAVLDAFRDRQPLDLMLETLGVDPPWATRREVRPLFVQLTMLNGWLVAGGQPAADDETDWYSIIVRIWNEDGPPRPWRSWEEERTGTPEDLGRNNAGLPVTAGLVVS